MRKLKLQVQITADGYMEGADGAMDWMTVPWSDDMNSYAQALHDPVDCIVLGRKLAEGFIPAWAGRTPEEGETQESIDFMNNTPKVVLSRTLTSSPWENATVAGDLVKTINDLKAQPGGEMITYGGGTLAVDLITEGLLDEIYLFVNPVLIGAGSSVFGNLGAYQRPRLVDAQPFDCGVTALHYELKHS
jgi:dihydrofolate reductase